MNAAQVYISRWINVVYPHNGILFIQKKEGSSDTSYNVDKPWKHYPKWKKPDTKGQTLCDSTYYEISEIGKFIETENWL